MRKNKLIINKKTATISLLLALSSSTLLISGCGKQAPSGTTALTEIDTSSADITTEAVDSMIKVSKSTVDNEVLKDENYAPTEVPGAYHSDIPNNFDVSLEFGTFDYDFRNDPELYNLLCDYAKAGYTISYSLGYGYTDEEEPKEVEYCFPQCAIATRANEEIYISIVESFSIDEIKNTCATDDYDVIEDTDERITLVGEYDYTLDGSAKVKEKYTYNKQTKILCNSIITPNDREYTSADFYDFTEYDYTTNEKLVEYAKIFEDQGFIVTSNTEPVYNPETGNLDGEVYIKDSCYCYKLNADGCNNEDVYIYIADKKLESIDEIAEYTPIDYIYCEKVIKSTEIENGYKIEALNEADGSKLEIFYYPDDNIYIIHRLESNAKG